LNDAAPDLNPFVGLSVKFLKLAATEISSLAEPLETSLA
jgi:hypothetical protein